MATPLSFKIKNQIFNDFLNVSRQGLAYFNITGWEFRQLNQPYKTNHQKPTVFVSIINNPQNGSQYKTKKQGVTINYTKNEVQIRFSALRHQLPNDDLSTINSADALEFIRQYLQSDAGILQLADLGYAQYRSGDIQPQSFINDSDNFQFLPFFDCTFIYTNSWQRPVNRISKVKEIDIYKI